MPLTPLQIFVLGLGKYFGIPKTQARDYLDLTFVQMREVQLDVIKFDEWLHEKHGEYEKDGLSMKEAITKFYSAEAANFVQDQL